MIHFQEIDLKKFLTDYWQKRPLVIRQAFSSLTNPITPDELAGLAMEEDIESRIVFETPTKAPYWHLRRGPFVEKDFKKLPQTHWTLLVQGVDRFVPEVTAMLNNFDFIPQWRMDDVMISYAAKYGSVGPHYDNYDVFLYQAMGTRKWSLTMKECHEENYLSGLDLRIMNQFEIEKEYILEEGDMLYLPPHVGHYGVAISDDCMTYSFGYRSYQSQELWDSFGEYLSENKRSTLLYKDPNWAEIRGASELPKQAWLNAKKLMQEILEDETQLASWFGCFATSLDQHAEELLPLPLDEGEAVEIDKFAEELTHSTGLIRNACCRFAYQIKNQNPYIALFINGCLWDVEGVSQELIKLVANQRLLDIKTLLPFLKNRADQFFLFELWKLQWLEIIT